MSSCLEKSSICTGWQGRKLVDLILASKYLSEMDLSMRERRKAMPQFRFPRSKIWIIFYLSEQCKLRYSSLQRFIFILIFIFIYITIIWCIITITILTCSFSNPYISVLSLIRYRLLLNPGGFRADTSRAPGFLPGGVVLDSIVPVWPIADC